MTHRVLVGVTAVVAVALLGSGAYSVADLFASKTTELSTTFETPGQINVDVDSGSITIAVDPDIHRPQVRATFRTGFAKPTLTTTDGSATTVHASCDWSLPWHSGQCNADVELLLPADYVIDVDAHTNSGSISVPNGIAGHLTLSAGSGNIDAQGGGHAVDARTSSGNVTVAGAGSVNAQSGSGSVKVTHATSATARTSSGDVTVRDCTGDVTATSGSGSVTVYAPSDAKPVRLDISTGSGSRTVDAPTDPNAKTSVTIRASSGSVAYLGSD